LPAEGLVQVGDDWRYSEWAEGGFVVRVGSGEGTAAAASPASSAGAASAPAAAAPASSTER
jgi:hypothetical protein